MKVGDHVKWAQKHAYTEPRWHRYGNLWQVDNPIITGTITKIMRTRAICTSDKGVVWNVALKNIII